MSWLTRRWKPGVRGYVVKTDAAKDLISAVQAALQGRTFFHGKRVAALAGNTRYLITQQTMALTVRESEIIRLLCEGKSN